MSRYIISLQEINRSMFLVAGGKGANLGEMSRIKGVLVSLNLPVLFLPRSL